VLCVCICVYIFGNKRSLSLTTLTISLEHYITLTVRRSAPLCYKRSGSPVTCRTSNKSSRHIGKSGCGTRLTENSVLGRHQQSPRLHPTVDNVCSGGSHLIHTSPCSAVLSVFTLLLPRDGSWQYAMTSKAVTHSWTSWDFWIGYQPPSSRAVQPAVCCQQLAVARVQRQNYRDF
jgi:hypothetical protein